MPTQTIFRHRYDPRQGGHAPGHLREAFCDWLDSYEADEPSDTVTVGWDEKQRPVNWLFGQLWNCTDIMPGIVCDILDLRAGSTYARGVRQLKAELSQ